MGGEILPDEFVDHPDDYGEWACAREFVEESGLVSVDEKTKENLFYLIERWWEDDHDLPRGNFNYENLVYWISEARSNPDENGIITRDTKGFPLPSNRGAPGETFAAFYIEVERLSGDNFHRKHAHIVRSALSQLATEGHDEYRPALEHFQENFPIITSLRNEKPSIENLIETVQIKTVLSSEEEFAKAMAGVTPIAR